MTGFSESLPTQLIHIHGCLRAIPTDICSYPNIQVLNLESNKISDINKITCLKSLEIFNFKANQLKHLSDTTFVNMTNLREVNLANNPIYTMDPHAFALEAGNILKYDLSGNKLQTIDVTNLVME